MDYSWELTWILSKKKKNSLGKSTKGALRLFLRRISADTIFFVLKDERKTARFISFSVFGKLHLCS